MKKCILTISIGDKYKRISEITNPIIDKYSKKVNADFISIDEINISKTSPHWEKFIIFDLLNKYDRIIYLDSDIIIRDDCPDLFEVVPYESIGMFNEAPFTDGRLSAIEKICIDYDTKIKKWDGKYYNTGVMVVSKCHKYIFKKPDKEIFNFYEQSYINMVLAKHDEISRFDLKYNFNRMCCMDSITGEERHAAYIIHYAGIPDVSILPALIEKDLKKWELSKPEYKFKKHILINVQGGLGDQIQAEPTIRYLLNNVYKDQDVRLVTHFPRIFTHLNLPIFKHGEAILENDVPYYTVVTLPGPETLTWTVVSNLLCHTVDFISMAVLRRTLPDKDKKIKLKIEDKDFENLDSILNGKDLSNMILIHPGRHWESKTFPKKWWEDIINNLVDKGHSVGIIGRNEGKDRGTVDIEVSEKVYDYRDLMDLGTLFAAISKAKVLISNDSSPIHIAGAFDNNIILIPTCKHPDHLLPYRNENKSYKSKALYKELTLDKIPQAPTEIYGSTADYVVGDILDYLPNIEDVVLEVIKIFEDKS